MHKILYVHQKKSIDANNINLALLHIRFTPLGPVPPHPAMALVNRPTRGLMTKITRTPVDYNHVEDNQNTL